jgi:UrcA family protein
MNTVLNRSFSTFILIAVALVLTLTALVGAPTAVAGGKPASLDPIVTVTVHFDDLDTSTAAGSHILYGRIIAAAEAVCNNAAADWYPSQHWARQECFRATLDSVVAKLNIPTVTALHFNKTRPHMVAAR